MFRRSILRKAIPAGEFPTEGPALRAGHSPTLNLSLISLLPPFPHSPSQTRSVDLRTWKTGSWGENTKHLPGIRAHMLLFIPLGPFCQPGRLPQKDPQLSTRMQPGATAQRWIMGNRWLVLSPKTGLQGTPCSLGSNKKKRTNNQLHGFAFPWKK